METQLPKERLIKAAWTVWIAIFALYHAAALYETRHVNEQVFRLKFGNIFWAASWKMFTRPSLEHYKVEFEGLRNGRWQRLEMEKWYPTRWESGYRWERPPFYNYPSRQKPFLSAACRKSGCEKVRLVSLRWKKILGSMQQTPVHPRKKVLHTLSCSDASPS